MGVMKYPQRLAAPALRKPKMFRLPFVTRRKPMTRLTLVAAALIAAALSQVQTAAARDVAARRTVPHAAADCVRAPAEGAYATAPYREPPCMPRTTN
jgi:hypothetical protein